MRILYTHLRPRVSEPPNLRRGASTTAAAVFALGHASTLQANDPLFLDIFDSGWQPAGGAAGTISRGLESRICITVRVANRRLRWRSATTSAVRYL